MRRESGYRRGPYSPWSDPKAGISEKRDIGKIYSEWQGRELGAWASDLTLLGDDVLFDSYGTEHYSGYQYIDGAASNTHIREIGQSFLGTGDHLIACEFYLHWHTTASGTCRAKLYAHTGTFGSSGLPTGSPLATSDDVNVSVIEHTSFGLVRFNFSTPYLLVDGTPYFIMFEYLNNDGIVFAYGGPGHAGNYAHKNGLDEWHYESGWDSIFYLYTSSTSWVVPGVLIEKPEHIVESIFQDELDVTDIDLDSITTTTAERETWKFARSLTQSASSLSYIESVCKEAALASTRTGSGSERLVALCNAGTTTINLTTTDIENDGRGGGVCAVRLSPLDDVFNEFYLNYNYNYYKGTYDKQLFCLGDSDNLVVNTRTNTDGNGSTYQALCLKSQEDYRKVNQWTFDADWIRDDATAELFIKVMMNWLARKKWIFSATLLYTENTLSLELGDRIKITHTLLPSSVSNTRQFIVTRLVDGGMSRIGRIDAEFLMIPEII
jgi:hypothetical protein